MFYAIYGTFWIIFSCFWFWFFRLMMVGDNQTYLLLVQSIMYRYLCVWVMFFAILLVDVCCQLKYVLPLVDNKGPVVSRHESYEVLWVSWINEVLNLSTVVCKYDEIHCWCYNDAQNVQRCNTFFRQPRLYCIVENSQGWTTYCNYQ